MPDIERPLAPGTRHRPNPPGFNLRHKNHTAFTAVGEPAHQLHHGAMVRPDPAITPSEQQATLLGWADGPLAYRTWSPGGRPRAVLVCIHGIGGHGVTFKRLGQALVPHGYAVEALDLPGHGHSPGRRGWLRRWRDWRDAVLVVLRSVHTRYPGIPMFLVGHSMGGTVVLDLALEEAQALQKLGVQGLILSNPALDPAGVAWWRLVLARLLSWLWPSFTLATGIADTAASRDPLVLAQRAADPWRHSRCSARLGSEFLDTTHRLRRGAPQLLQPLLLLQGGADQVTPAAGGQQFFAAAGSPDKTLLQYPESYHELYDDLDRDQVFADLITWLNRHGTGLVSR